MQFKDVIGQEEVKKRLINTVKGNRISHAQLFLGQEGSGNLALAIAYAQYINCHNRSENDSCGECSSCKKYQKLIHPDLHFVYPVTTTKSVTKDPVSDHFLDSWREIILNSAYFSENTWYAKIGVENKQGQIGKRESEEIIRKLNLKTFEAEYKVMIIWLPEKMNTTCSNKLLKLIEEPPNKTLFLMVSVDADTIIQTILSRTQLIKLPKIDKESIKNYILEKYTSADIDVANLAHLADGSICKLEEVLNSSEENEYNYEKFTELMRLSYARKIIELVQWVDELASIGREKQKSFISYALRLIRENFIYNFSEPEMVYLTIKEKDFSSKFAPFIQEWNVFPIVEELNKAYSHIERNGNGKIILLDFTLKLVKMIRK